jgi:hypothetical protein
MIFLTAHEREPIKRARTVALRCTILSTYLSITTHAPRNADARQPQDTSVWPPDIIFDLFYAVATINAWSPESFIKYVREQSKDVYYKAMTKMTTKIMTMCWIVAGQVMSMHRWAVKQQDNLDLNVMVYVEETRRQTFTRKKDGSLI